jgi:hypothetical protein
MISQNPKLSFIFALAIGRKELIFWKMSSSNPSTNKTKKTKQTEKF